MNRVLPLDASNVFHLLAFLWYTRVWAWHFTPDAALLPGARGFGWFFKYLTFYSYTLQLFQLGLCCLIFVFKASVLCVSLCVVLCWFCILTMSQKHTWKERRVEASCCAPPRKSLNVWVSHPVRHEDGRPSPFVWYHNGKIRARAVK
jgi:hypothetical protein